MTVNEIGEDPVDEAARLMFDATFDFLDAVHRSEDPDPTPMIEAATAYKFIVAAVNRVESGEDESIEVS